MIEAKMCSSWKLFFMSVIAFTLTFTDEKRTFFHMISHDFRWKNRKHWIRWPSIKENHFFLHSTHQHKAHLIIMTYEHLLLSTSFSSVISHEDRTFVMQHCRQWSMSNIHIWILKSHHIAHFLTCHMKSDSCHRLAHHIFNDEMMKE